MIPTWISHEPILWLTLIEALCVCLAAFGLPISDEQRVALLGVGGAILAITAAIGRQSVTPTSKIPPAAKRIIRDKGFEAES